MNCPKAMILSLSVVFLAACGATPEPTEPARGPYLGQTPPGTTPELFAPGIVSTRARELNAAFTPDGNELYFTRRIDDRNTLMTTRRLEGAWTPPAVAGFSGTFADVDPFVARDGRRLYFSSKRPLEGPGEPKDADLWYLERDEAGAWGEPVHLGGLNTQDRDDYYTSLSDDGVLYFSIFDSDGKGDIYRAQGQDGGFGPAERVADGISTEASEHDPFVAPDGSYLIFTSDRPGGHGSGDLYISFADPDGTWTKPLNMGGSINSAHYDFCAMLSPDGKYLFFTSRNDIYWVDARVIETLRPAGADRPVADPTAAEETAVLFAIDSEQPPEVHIDRAGSATIRGLQRLAVRYDSPAGGHVTADLFVPPGRGPFAGVLVMHGLPGGRHQMRDLAAILAEMGAVALAIDAPFARRRGPPLRWDERDRSEQIQLVQDLRRGIDLLAARDDVDEERLGYFGASYGAAIGGLLAGVERRLKAYVLLCGDGGPVTHYTGPEDAGRELYLLAEADRRAWLELMTPIEPIHFVGRAAPASLLFVNGRTDRLVPARDARVYQEAGSEPKTIRWYDAGHMLTRQAMMDSFEWIADALELEGRPPRARPDAS